jgi:large subunit ribosomal protein L5
MAKQAKKPVGTYVPRLKQQYQAEIVAKLAKEFGIANVSAVPKLEKIVLNSGLGEATQNVKILDDAVVEIAAIAGQRPVITRARKSVAAFISS